MEAALLIIRPIAREDLGDLVALAGMLDSINLPSDPEFLAGRIEHSLRGVSGTLHANETGPSVFVLEDLEAGRCVSSSMHSPPSA